MIQLMELSEGDCWTDPESLMVAGGGLQRVVCLIKGTCGRKYILYNVIMRLMLGCFPPQIPGLNQSFRNTNGG